MVLAKKRKNIVAVGARNKNEQDEKSVSTT